MQSCKLLLPRANLPGLSAGTFEEVMVWDPKEEGLSVRQLDTFPYKIGVIQHQWIPMKDGTRLAARLWLPRTEVSDSNMQ